MRLLHFQSPNGYRFGLKTAAGVADIALAAEALDIDGLPVSLPALCAGGSAARAALQQLLIAAEREAARQPAWLLPEASLTLAPCVPQPGKIICVGLNYRPHAAESKMEIPEFPVLFSKFNNSLTGAGAAITIPAGVMQMDYEAELAVVMGSRCQDVPEASALSHVLGYCNANDLSARDLQFRTGQWLLGKSPDGFCPLGPYLVTADSVPNPDALAIRCTVNGEVRQESNTRHMIFSCRFLISYISRYITLEPGDVILTGTPEGVALGRPDKPWLKPGDRVTVAVEGLGELTNTLVGAR